MRGIARGTLDDLENGLLPDFTAKVRGEVEGDFLAQARRLLEDGLKNPAAMLIGAGIEKMNLPLRQAAVYGLPQGQQVTAWAAIRNKADHGRFADYSEAEVRTMHQGVAGFIATHRL